MINLRKLACAMLVTFSMCGDGVAEDFSEAEFIEGSDKTFSAYPGSESRMARTARVMVSFIIKKDGTVAEPMIERINNDRFSKNVLKWTSLRNYKPATVDGQPVDSWQRQRFGFNIAFDYRSGRVSTELFNKHYKNFNTEISKEQPDQEKLQESLKRMAGSRHGSTLAYEMISSSRYKYAEKFLDRDAQIYALREMMLSNDRNIAVAKGTIADQELIRLLIEAGYYGEALEAYNDARYKLRSDYRAQLRELFAPTIAQITDIINSDQAFSRPVKVGESGYTFLPLAKPNFGFDDIIGKFETIKLRCERKFAELKFVADSDYQIPENWGACQLQLLGKDGASAQLVQY